jgi:protein phosphatase
LNAQHCHNCGAECGTIWWAIIASEPTLVCTEVGKNTSFPTEPGENQNNSDFFPSKFTAGSYLDPQQRYQLLDSIPDSGEIIANIEYKARVLDCQPYQISPIEAILANEPNGLITDSVGASGIPALARAYIGLQAEIQPGIPLIHDAWQQGNMQVVLLEDRSHWQPLLELCQDETTSSFQILHWCYQMALLWAVLEPMNCCQSLLELSNLRLDEDQTLALQRLYVEPVSQSTAELSSTVPEPPLSIKALGRLWQALFRQSQRTQFGSVVQMLEDIEDSKIETLVQLRSRLEEIATELETLSQPRNYPTEEKVTTTPTMMQLDHNTSDDGIGKNDDMPTIVLSMQLSSLEDAGRTDVGRQRHHNEDYFGIETKINKLELPKSRIVQARGLYILCDGMGGHASGEVASELAATTLRQYFQEHWITNQLPTEDSIREAVYLANQAIYDQNQQDSRSGVGRMGTTLVMLLLQDNHAAVAHVGDSRLYSVTRKRGLEQVTVDHEVGQREIARGVEPTIAYTRPDAYQLTQALGPRDEHSLNPSVEFLDINEDTLLVLASDGLSDNDLLEINWRTHLEPLLSSGANLELGISNLIDLANQHNGHDNITAIIVRVKVRPNQESLK